MATFAEIELIPASELTIGASASIRHAIVASLVAQASKELSLPPDKLVVRDIRPLGDLDYTYEDWMENTGATAGAFETMTTGSMGDQRFVGIYGLKLKGDSADACSQIRVNVGGGDRIIWHIQSLSKRDDWIGFCPAGVIIPQNAAYTISRYVRAVSVPFYCQLKGVAVEPRGKLISP